MSTNLSCMDAARWHASLAMPAMTAPLNSDGTVTVSRFRDIDKCIVQPALRETIVAIHLGGPKRVTRWNGHSRSIFDVEENSLTIARAQEACRWTTEGPVDFAHIVLADDFLSKLVAEEFGHDPCRVEFLPSVGLTTKLTSALCCAILADVESREAALLYRESLLISLIINLIRDRSSTCGHTGDQNPDVRTSRARGGLSGRQRSRVIDYMRERLHTDIGVSELVALTGLSRAQFFRAFSSSMGRSPYAFLTDIRTERARDLLASTRLPICDIAQETGLQPRQLSAAFIRRFGCSLGNYRKRCSEVGISPDYQQSHTGSAACLSKISTSPR